MFHIMNNNIIGKNGLFQIPCFPCALTPCRADSYHRCESCAPFGVIVVRLELRSSGPHPQQEPH